MKIRPLMFLFLIAIAPSPAAAQTVPEGIHSDAEGPSTICGLTGSDAVHLMRQVRASPTLTEQAIQSDRFELYASAIRGDSFVQWALTRQTEPAHPAVTCRHVYREDDGSWYQRRGMRCDAGREACDRLFTEFRELDERVRQEMMGRP